MRPSVAGCPSLNTAYACTSPVRFVEAWTIADRRRSPAPRPVQRRASLSSPGSFANTASPAHRHLGYPRASGPRWSGAVSRWPARSPRAGRHRRRRDTDGVGALATIGVAPAKSLDCSFRQQPLRRDRDAGGPTGVQFARGRMRLRHRACLRHHQRAGAARVQHADAQCAASFARRDHRRRHAARAATTGRSPAQDPLFAAPLVLRLHFSVQLLSGAEITDF